jgi:hypothetical protein
VRENKIEQAPQKQKDLEAEVINKAKNNRLTCPAALKIANDFSVPPSRIGEAANRLKIKISSCQLGCF